MYNIIIKYVTSLVVQWSESLTTNHEVPGSIPGSTVGIFPEGEDSRGDHGLVGQFKLGPKTEGIHWNAPQLVTVIA